MANRKKQQQAAAAATTPAPAPATGSGTFDIWRAVAVVACLLAIVSMATTFSLSSQLTQLRAQLENQTPTATGVSADQLAQAETRGTEALARAMDTLRAEQRTAVRGLARKAELDGFAGSTELAQLRRDLEGKLGQAVTPAQLAAATRNLLTADALAAATKDVLRHGSLGKYVTADQLRHATRDVVRSRDLEPLATRTHVAAATDDVVRRKDVAEFATRSDLTRMATAFATKQALADATRGLATRRALTAATKNLARKADLEPFATKQALKGLARKADLAPFATKQALASAVTTATRDVARKADLAPFATKQALAAATRHLAATSALEPYATKAALDAALADAIGRDDLKKVLVGMMEMTRKIVGKEVAGVGRKLDASKARIAALEKEVTRLANPKGSPNK